MIFKKSLQFIFKGFGSWSTIDIKLFFFVNLEVN